jgi:hypothetical protein
MSREAFAIPNLPVAASGSAFAQSTKLKLRLGVVGDSAFFGSLLLS